MIVSLLKLTLKIEVDKIGRNEYHNEIGDYA